MHLNSQQITDLLIGVQAVITLLIATRAFSFYFRTRSDVLLSLGLAMGIIGIGGVTGVIDDPFLKGNPTFNTIWFRHLGQVFGYLFIFLASLGGTAYYRKQLKLWTIILTIALLILMLLTPILPNKQPPSTTGYLSILRCFTCTLAFFSYTVNFFRKETRFSFLMALSFLILSASLWVYAMKFFLPPAMLYEYLADGSRIVGLIILYMVFLVA
jgi:hypothetical protein